MGGDSLEHLSLESDLALQEHSFNFRVLKEAILIGIVTLKQFVEWLHRLGNTVTHSFNQEGIKGSKHLLGELGDADVDTEGSLYLGDRLEQEFYFLTAHLEVFVSNLLDAFLKLSQAHHLKMSGVNQPLELLLSQIASFYDTLCDPHNFIRYKVKLRHTLNFSQERSVSEEPKVLRVKDITEEPLFLGAQINTKLVQGCLELCLLKLSKVLQVHLLEDRANSYALVLWAVQPAFQAYQELFNICNLSCLVSFLINQRNWLAYIFEGACLTVVHDYWLHLALQNDVVIL